MKVVGYSDLLGVKQGSRIRFMVSADGEYEARLVRPSHSAKLREELDAPFNGRYQGREQSIPAGSHIRFARPVPRPAEFRMSAWVLPTAPGRGALQGLMTWGSDDGLFLNDRGEPELRIGGARLATGTPLRRGEWYRLECGLQGGRAFVVQTPRRWDGEARAEAERAPSDVKSPFRIGHQFDGKIESPQIDGVAAWDFSVGITTLRVHDTSPRQLHGELMQMPMRAVTGHNWTGRELDFRRVPQEYAAIHFHHDDLADCGWHSDFSFDVPTDLPCGMYAVRLRCEDGEDHLPFFVTPPEGRVNASVAFLAPTFSYLAYSDEFFGIGQPQPEPRRSPFMYLSTSDDHYAWESVPPLPPDERARILASAGPEDRWALENGLLSSYDNHRDGTGNCFVSRLRPLVNMRPYYEAWELRGPHQLSADLHVLDWLGTTGRAHDVITDDDLHTEGLDLLSRYRVVVSGTHPEYWSGDMLDALEAWLQAGGRFMYLGGNGLYWVTTPHPAAPHVLEIRRTNAGTRAWESAPGECHHQGTGEPAGLWRYRGRAPQSLVGVGMTAHGVEESRPFVQEPRSGDDRGSWIFDGIAADEEIGGFGALLGGAGGYELDRIDYELGTPPHAMHLATATGFSDIYQGVVEEVFMANSRQGGTVDPRVRADLVYFETPNQGAVFSTGSICWGTSLTHDDCDNNVSRLTGNVLDRFAADDA
ncbi:N,N-dimethylformamidase beta subunit family domain-containing protein [Capillimicrobium parvum]|uniref:N,N-dimethylformamidase beta subunit n=1 Tax=Capillimicrobium parvum TaxID=2884022 RepID=A0A9E6XXQ6_9ACTN|nr:N,N-dimethylformamidase beta subunit family domain-containing protein [Capillimicrobium parvum]UGS36038.1 N,N-dimethylformamidase beta subunit [Capillimicrobium parvum]